MKIRLYTLLLKKLLQVSRMNKEPTIKQARLQYLLAEVAVTRTKEFLCKNIYPEGGSNYICIQVRQIKPAYGFGHSIIYPHLRTFNEGRKCKNLQ